MPSRTTVALLALLAVAGPALAADSKFQTGVRVSVGASGQDPEWSPPLRAGTYADIRQISVYCAINLVGTSGGVVLRILDARNEDQGLFIPVPFAYTDTAASGSPQSYYVANIQPTFRMSEGIKLRFHATATDNKEGLCSVGLFGDPSP